MNRSNRRRRNVALGADLLESRQLLNAHLPQSPVAHVALVHAEAKKTKPITGKLAVTVTIDSIDPDEPPPIYPGPPMHLSATGTSTVGTVALTASTWDVITISKDRSTYKFSFPAGTGTITLGNGSTLDLAFTGTGQGRKPPPGKESPTTYSYKGTATVTSGPDLGRVYKFTASGSRVPHSSSQMLRFTLA